MLFEHQPAILNFRFARSCRRGAGRGAFAMLVMTVHDYDELRDYLSRQKQLELVLSFERIEEIIGHALPRAAQRASWWDTLRSPQEKMPQREACLAAGFVATRMPDGRRVRFRKMK
jgi:hypothetical protein